MRTNQKIYYSYESRDLVLLFENILNSYRILACETTMNERFNMIGVITSIHDLLLHVYRLI